MELSVDSKCTNRNFAGQRSREKETIRKGCENNHRTKPETIQHLVKNKNAYQTTRAQRSIYEGNS